MKVRLKKTLSPARICMAGAAVSILLLGFPAQAFYNPSTGRWLNRDPAEEAESPNLTCALANDMLGGVDTDGLARWDNLRPVEAGAGAGGALGPGRPGPKPSPPQLGPVLFPVLTYFATGAPTCKDWGFFEWGITWYLDRKFPASSAEGGSIIQYMSLEINLKRCDGTPLSLPQPPPSLLTLDPKWWPFYEGWNVPGKQRVTKTHLNAGTGFDDIWRLGPFPCTQGSVKFTGVASYYDGVGVPGYFFPGLSPIASGLPKSRLLILTIAPTATVTRTLTATWTCEKRRTQVTVGGE
jgi:hypothetical protein